MKSIPIYKKLTWFNELPRSEAEYVLSECFDSAEWVVEVTASRPFFMLDQLFVRAEELWQLLSKSDTSLERRIGWTDVEARLAKLLER